MDAELHKSINNGDLSTAMKLLKNGADINSLFGMRGTPLCAAINAKNSVIVDYLLDSGCDVNAKDFDGEPPLCLALRKELYDLAEKLIAKKHCDINKRDPISGQNPIHIAVTKGNYDIVVFLLQHSCNINAKDTKGNTALHLAINSLHTSIARCLIESGCDKYITDDNGQMAIHTCVVQHDMTTLQYILSQKYVTSIDGEYVQKYIDIKTKGVNDTALLLAVKNENLGAVCTLVKHECDIESVNSLGETALFLACKRNRVDIAICLLEARACPNILSNQKKEFHVHTKLQRAAPIHEAISLGNLLLVKKLIEHHADINMEDSLGQTPLFIALNRNKSAIADHILTVGLDAGLDVNAVTKNGRNLLFAVASCTEPARFAKRLIELGCDVNLERQSAGGRLSVGEPNTPLEHAVEMVCLPMVEVLLENGARTDIYNTSGESLLHLCAVDDLVDMTAALIQWGADMHAHERCAFVEGLSDETDKHRGSTPIASAIDAENFSIVKLFVSCGCKVESKLKKYLNNLTGSSLEYYDQEDVGILQETMQMANNPLRLKNLCRLEILRSIQYCGGSVLGCSTLPLPRDLINYLRYKELDVFKYE